MASPCDLVTQIDQAIEDIVAMGSVQDSTQGALRWRKYDLEQLQNLRRYYANLCNAEDSDANNGGLIMSKITNKEPC